MSKPIGGHWKGTSGYNAEVKRLIAALPRNPDTLINKGWKEITHSTMQDKGLNSREFIEPKTALVARFDKASPNGKGFNAVDHYHVENPIKQEMATHT